MMDNVHIPVTCDTGQQVGATSEPQGSPKVSGPSPLGSPGVSGSHLPSHTSLAPKEHADPNLDWKTVQNRKGRLPAGKTAAFNPSSTTPKFKMPLWNSRGRKQCNPQGLNAPSQIWIDKVPIYVQHLTSEQVLATNVEGWNEVLANIKGLNKEASEHRIGVFWAHWKQQYHLTQRAMLQKHKDLKFSKDTQSTKANEACGHSNQTAQTTPKGGERAKRKHTGTPGSSEPPGKRLYAAAAGAGGARCNLDDSVHILWVQR